MPQHKISTAIVRYIVFYIMQHDLRKGTPPYSDVHRNWVMADRDVKRDWGW